MYTLLLRLHLSSKQHNANMTLLLPIMQDMQHYNITTSGVQQIRSYYIIITNSIILALQKKTRYFIFVFNGRLYFERNSKVRIIMYETLTIIRPRFIL